MGTGYALGEVFYYGFDSDSVLLLQTAPDAAAAMATSFAYAGLEFGASASTFTSVCSLRRITGKTYLGITFSHSLNATKMPPLCWLNVMPRCVLPVLRRREHTQLKVLADAPNSSPA